MRAMRGPAGIRETARIIGKRDAAVRKDRRIRPAGLPVARVMPRGMKTTVDNIGPERNQQRGGATDAIGNLPWVVPRHSLALA